MRKFKLLALAFVIGIASLFAVNVDNPEKPTKEIRNEIVKLLQQPDFVVKEDITVVLKFTFSSDGEIVVLCPGCENKDIVKYIRKNLNYKKFKNPGERDKVYLMPLKIKAA
jgi:hypothetical protein